MGNLEVQFGGLRALELDELIPFESALECLNCYVDAGGIQGRNGYVKATAAAIGSGSVQGAWRFRPGDDPAMRTVVARGGHIYLIVDPSSESASDGVVTDLGLVFGATAAISGVQLGKYFYLCDDAGNAWRRITPAFALEAFSQLPKVPAPTVTAGTLTFTKFSSLAAPALGGGGTEAASVIADWRALGGPVGATITYSLAADQDWSAMRWLFVACSPNTIGNGGGSFAVEIATLAGSFETLVDNVADTPGNDAPYCIYLALAQLSASTRSAVRRIRFRQAVSANAFYASGFMTVPSAPSPGAVTYFLTTRNSTSGQESSIDAVNDAISVVYSSDNIQWPAFHAARVSYAALVEAGANMTVNPDSLTASALYNKGGGLAYPSSNEFYRVQTFAGTAPAGSYDKMRLYRVTSVGTQLVKEIAVAPGSGYSITDDTGDATLTHALYKPGGSPPTGRAIASLGGRLIAGGDPAAPNRLNVSSFVAFGQTSDPFPQFPTTPQIASDGYAYDLSPTASEQILWLGEGDRALYVATNESVFVLTDLAAPLSGQTPPLYRIWGRGSMGRRAVVWAENQLFWAAHDGIYSAQGRQFNAELTQTIRRIYSSWFLPDATTLLSYQDRKLYAVCGTRMLRFDFVSQTWSRHTLSHTMQHAAFWRDPAGTLQKLWFLASDGNVYRWQATATSDAGTAIPAWVYSTGYDMEPEKSRISFIYCDRSADVTIKACANAAERGPNAKTFSGAGESELPVGADQLAYRWRLKVTGANTATVRRVTWDRLSSAKRGAA